MSFTLQRTEPFCLRWAIRLILISACWLAAGPIAISADKPSAHAYHRPCRASDLEGTWEVVQYRALVALDDKGKAGSYFHRHQRYQFAADGTLKSMTSTKPFQDADSRAFDRVPRVISYRFPSDGQLETTRTDLPDDRERWVCHFVTREVSDAARHVDLRQGDVVMTLLDREGKPFYIRQMRRLAN